MLVIPHLAPFLYAQLVPLGPKGDISRICFLSSSCSNSNSNILSSISKIMNFSYLAHANFKTWWIAAIFISFWDLILPTYLSFSAKRMFDGKSKMVLFVVCLPTELSSEYWPKKNFHRNCPWWTWSSRPHRSRVLLDESGKRKFGYNFEHMFLNLFLTNQYKSAAILSSCRRALFSMWSRCSLLRRICLGVTTCRSDLFVLKKHENFDNVEEDRRRTKVHHVETLGERLLSIFWKILKNNILHYIKQSRIRFNR